MRVSYLLRFGDEARVAAATASDGTTGHLLGFGELAILSDCSLAVLECLVADVAVAVLDKSSCV